MTINYIYIKTDERKNATVSTTSIAEYKGNIIWKATTGLMAWWLMLPNFLCTGLCYRNLGYLPAVVL